jgi:hypothetical protein
MRTAQRAIQGFEAVRMLRKGQLLGSKRSNPATTSLAFALLLKIGNPLQTGSKHPLIAGLGLQHFPLNQGRTTAGRWPSSSLFASPISRAQDASSG